MAKNNNLSLQSNNKQALDDFFIWAKSEDNNQSYNKLFQDLKNYKNYIYIRPPYETDAKEFFSEFPLKKNTILYVHRQYLKEFTGKTLNEFQKYKTNSKKNVSLLRFLKYKILKFFIDFFKVDVKKIDDNKIKNYIDKNFIEDLFVLWNLEKGSQINNITLLDNFYLEDYSIVKDQSNQEFHRETEKRHILWKELSFLKKWFETMENLKENREILKTNIKLDKIGLMEGYINEDKIVTNNQYRIGDLDALNKLSYYFILLDEVLEFNKRRTDLSKISPDPSIDSLKEKPKKITIKSKDIFNKQYNITHIKILLSLIYPLLMEFYTNDKEKKVNQIQWADLEANSLLFHKHYDNLLGCNGGALLEFQSLMDMYIYELNQSPQEIPEAIFKNTNGFTNELDIALIKPIIESMESMDSMSKNNKIKIYGLMLGGGTILVIWDPNQKIKKQKDN